MTANGDAAHTGAQLAPDAGQPAITAPLPPANGELADPSDDEMSAVSPEEVAARQAQLNAQSREFTEAEHGRAMGGYQRGRP